MSGVTTLRESANIAETYGVKNSLTWVKRDLYQNFFDGMTKLGIADPLAQIVVRSEYLPDGRKRLVVRGPSAFNLDYVLILGATDKAGVQGQIGDKGEGLKICALLLLRDFGIDVTYRSGRYDGQWEARAVWVERDIDDHPTKILHFEISKEDRYDGPTFSEVELVGSIDRIGEFYDISVDTFFAGSRNPFLAQPIGAGIYARPEGQPYGRVFLAGIDRGEDYRLSFIYRIDDKLPEDNDRDRKTLSFEALVTAIHKCYASPFCPKSVFTTLIEKRGGDMIQHYAGNPEIAAFKRLDNWHEIWREVNSFNLKRFSYSEHEPGNQWEYDKLGRFGVQQVTDPMLIDILRDEGVESLEAKRDAITRSSAIKITDGSRHARKIMLLTQAFQSAGIPMPRIKVFKAHNEADIKLLGVYEENEVALNEELFAGPFSKALTTVLHERAHRAGERHSEEFHRAFLEDVDRMFGVDHAFPIEHLKLLAKLTKEWGGRKRASNDYGDDD